MSALLNRSFTSADRDWMKPLTCRNCGQELRVVGGGWNNENHWVPDSWTDPGYWTCDPAESPTEGGEPPSQRDRT